MRVVGEASGEWGRIGHIYEYTEDRAGGVDSRSTEASGLRKGIAAEIWRSLKLYIRFDKVI